REREREALREPRLRLEVVLADAQDLGVLAGKLRDRIAKRRHLLGSTACEGLGEEGEDERLALVVGERGRLPVAGLDRDRGRRRTHRAGSRRENERER